MAEASTTEMETSAVDNTAEAPVVKNLKCTDSMDDSPNPVVGKKNH